uniref:Uncharacterized protein n=1 Tax=Rhizophora mucronata TaxID=61149 RepID=A0A2P2PV31_RHIMU
MKFQPKSICYNAYPTLSPFQDMLQHKPHYTLRSYIG